jgi:hypothetical protein
MNAGSKRAVAAIAKITTTGTILAIRSNLRGGVGLTGMGRSFDLVIGASQNRSKE